MSSLRFFACWFCCATLLLTGCDTQESLFDADIYYPPSDMPAQDLSWREDMSSPQPAPAQDMSPEPDMRAQQPGEPAPSIFFDLDAAAASGKDAYYDFPMPSDLRLDRSGRPDVSNFLAPSNPLILELKSYVESGPTGFAPHTTSYMRLTHQPDPSAAGKYLTPPDIERSPVWLINVTPDSVEYGRKMPIELRFTTRETPYRPAYMLNIRPIPGSGMRPGEAYAVVVRRGLQSVDGVSFEESQEFADIRKAHSNPQLTFLAQTYWDTLFARLSGLGIDQQELIAASMYTLSDPRPELDALVQAAKRAPLLEVGPWRIIQQDADSVLLEGSFLTSELLSGQPPFDRKGSGIILFDAMGSPVEQRRAPVRISMRVPTAPAPMGGYPVVLYSHGTGGTAFSGTASNTSPGVVLAREGIVTVGFDGALHGVRTQKEFDFASRVLGNIIVVREMIRQSVVDQIVLLRHARAGDLSVPGELLGRQQDAHLSQTVWVMGHSQGGQQNGLLLGANVSLGGALFSAAPGAITHVLVDQELNGQRLGCLLGIAVRVECEDVTYDHPAINLLYLQFHAMNDGVNYLARTYRERPAHWGPAPHIVLTEGLLDTFTPPESLEALAAALGVPLVAPLQSRGDALSAQQTSVVEAPIEQNLTLSSGQKVTAGLFQFAELDHFATFRDPAARSVYVSFFASGFTQPAPRVSTDALP